MAGDRFTEADAVALLRPRCDYCHDDMNLPIRVAVDILDGFGVPVRGQLICTGCFEDAGFTGWNADGGGWPDPLGHDEPIREEGDTPASHREIAAALQGKPWRQVA